MEPLTIFGLATYTIFKPVLEDIAKGVAEDAAKSYVGKAFKSVFSVIHKKPLTKAVGGALAELLKLIENELLDADLSEDEVRTLTPFVKLLVEHEAVCGSLEPLFLEPDFYLDPKTIVDVNRIGFFITQNSLNHHAGITRLPFDICNCDLDHVSNSLFKKTPYPNILHNF